MKHDVYFEVTYREQREIRKLIEAMRKSPTPDMIKWASLGKTVDKEKQ